MGNELLLYLFQASLVHAILFIIYRFTVSQLTFYKLNRIILLGIAVFSITLPLLDLSFLVHVVPSNTLQQRIPITLETFEMGKFVGNSGLDTTAVSPAFSLNLIQIVFSIYMLGIGITLSRFFHSIHRILNIKRDSTKISMEGHSIYATRESNSFSFLNWIFIPLSKSNSIEKMVLDHELAHVRYKHSLDLILVQIYTAFFWFNPLIYNYQKHLKIIHEYQADSMVLGKGNRPSTYLDLILKNFHPETANQSLSYFNNLIIKKRIEMITKSKSTKASGFMYSLLMLSIIFISLGFALPEMEETQAAPEKMINIENNQEPPSIFPLEEFIAGNITSRFNQQIKDPKTNKVLHHNGIDIRAKKGTPVIATANGTILKAENKGDWGNLVVIQHADSYQSVYAHLHNFNVSRSDTVKKGDIIGYVGNTGRSTGPHLHYEVRKDSRNLDPSDYFEE